MRSRTSDQSGHPRPFPALRPRKALAEDDWDQATAIRRQPYGTNKCPARAEHPAPPSLGAASRKGCSPSRPPYRKQVITGGTAAKAGSRPIEFAEYPVANMACSRLRAPLLRVGTTKPGSSLRLLPPEQGLRGSMNTVTELLLKLIHEPHVLTSGADWQACQKLACHRARRIVKMSQVEEQPQRFRPPAPDWTPSTAAGDT